VTARSLNTAIEGRESRNANSARAESAVDALSKYTRDLTQAARDWQTRPVIGRDNPPDDPGAGAADRERPWLIGEPGVSRTVVEGRCASPTAASH
jgi:ATP-dependent Clp protease ATP-binding subunit ClpB